MADYGDIINAAYRKVGIGVPTTADQTNALEALNNMVGIMGVEGLFPYVTRESFAMTVGQDTYTIGSGGSFDTVRPLSIKSIFIRDSNNSDYPITIYSMQEYNSISLKSQSGRPTKAYFIPEYPLAKIIFNYDADEAYTIFFEFDKNFTEVANTSTTVALPNEYKAMLIYNLAVILAEDKKITLPQTVYVLAQYYKDLLDKNKAVTTEIPITRFDMATGVNLNIKTDDYSG